MNIIDLFSGCGGMSLGFRMAEAKIVLANEIDEWAAMTYEKNHSKTNLLCKDIRKIVDWRKTIQKSLLNKIDGVIGGPPCQGFSLSGNRDASDPRNSLFMDFIRCVKYFEPVFFVMENVKGLLSMKTANKDPVIEIILNEFDKAGYNSDYSVLNSAWFGVPQLRERVFIVGISKAHNFDKSLLFPAPRLKSKDFISVNKAISDLPRLQSGEGHAIQDYISEPKNLYQRWARKDSNGVLNHISMRHTDRVIERFRIIKPGQSVAHVPMSHSALKRGNPNVKSGKVFSQNNMRVFGKHPSPTIAASFQSNFIHPILNRNFTAREAARLQSFPDRYVFMGKRTTMSWEKHLSQYQQIGNAVPPLLAQAIAFNLIKYFSTQKIILKSLRGKR
jgi:DNA (cytosine-5)-methyltransferase 1